MKTGFVRIIGGKWRSRRLKVTDVSGLRPTPDRVRETLFNWLTPAIQGARCLDLFAGSGALGFEALSRGASYVTMVDQSIEVVNLLQAQLALFDAVHACIYRAEIPRQLRAEPKPFDIVFLDPPYQKGLLLPTCFYLEEHRFLAQSAYIYLEADKIIQPDELPAHWQMVHCKKAGQVIYHLALREKKHE